MKQKQMKEKVTVRAGTRAARYSALVVRRLVVLPQIDKSVRSFWDQSHFMLRCHRFSRLLCRRSLGGGNRANNQPESLVVGSCLHLTLWLLNDLKTFEDMILFLSLILLWSQNESCSEQKYRQQEASRGKWLQNKCQTSGSCLLLRSKLSLFQSRSSLQRASVKVPDITCKRNQPSVVTLERPQSAVWPFALQLKAKRNECNSKSTHGRNEYLLTLAAANAHQQRYYNTDLVDCIKVRLDTLNIRRAFVRVHVTRAVWLKMYFCVQVLDGRIYEQVKDYLVSLCQTELEGYQEVHNTFSHVLNRSSGVSLQLLRSLIYITKSQ